jgi:hypothetical protein
VPRDDSPSGCAYEVDDQLRLVSVDERWSSFALANDAPELLPPQPFGKPLLGFIGDDVTRALYGRLFERVSGTGSPIVVSIRCDAPTLRRLLSLEISPRPAGGLRIETSLLRAKAREPVPLLDRRANHTGADKLLRMCSWCKMIDVDDRWREVEEAANALRLLEKEALPAITHTICDPCLDRVTAGLDAERGKIG